jgi:hypothetical protein
MSHVIREIAEAETVTAVEGHMRGAAIARLLHSAGVDGHITQTRIALEPRALFLPPDGCWRAVMARDDRSRELGSRVADRGVVPMMGAKETSPPEERPRPEDDPNEQARDRTLGRASLQLDSTGSKWRRDGRAIPGSRRCCTTSTRPRYCARFGDNGVWRALGL